MNTDQQNRFEIMKALEKDFPDRLLEELIDVALYVEVGGVERARLKESAEKFFETLRHLNPPTPADEEAKEFHRKVKEDGDRMRLGLDPIHLKIPDTPRKWTNPHAIPSSVKAITDRDGDRAEPQTILGKRRWVFTDEPFGGLGVTPNDGPFTEVLENE